MKSYRPSPLPVNAIRLIFLLVIMMAVGRCASAATFTVDNTTDNAGLTACTAAANDCSLRGAIANANASGGDDVINFDASVFATSQTIMLTPANGQLTINSVGSTGSLTINGTGADKLIISGGDGITNTNRVFIINSGTLILNSVTIRNGRAIDSPGGAILNLSGTLTLNNSVISGNSAVRVNFNSDGGGIAQFNGTLTIINSTISGNSAGGPGGIAGGVYTASATLRITSSTFSGNTAGNVGGIRINGGDVQMTNSTFSGNTSTNTNGSGFAAGIDSAGQTLLTNCTITLNDSVQTAANSAGGLHHQGGLMHLRNTIIAGNTSANINKDVLQEDTLVSLGNNLIGNNTGAATSFPVGIPNASSDYVGDGVAAVNAKLSPLGNYGGPTLTHKLLITSPALDHGNNCVTNSTCPSDPPFGPLPLVNTDQRGVARPANGVVDIGSFERTSSDNQLIVTTLDDLLNPADGLCSLREAITAANTNVPSGAVAGECDPGSPGLDKIEFALGAGTPTINVGAALPDITEPVLIDGATGGATRVALHATFSGYDGLRITAGGSTVKSLVINGFTEGASGTGGAIRLLTNGGNTIQNCYLGTDASGAVAVGNHDGLVVDNSPNNVIGGITVGQRNIMSGNNHAGVFITGAGATDNQLLGNYVGASVSGLSRVGNNFGVVVYAAANNTIGGATAGARNVISGNNQTGVTFYQSSGNQLLGNYIGTDAGGTGVLGNLLTGIDIESSTNCTVGGTAAGARNIISANYFGVTLISATNNEVLGNYIGTDRDGLLDLGNSQSGVWMSGGSTNNTIGGATIAARNVISGNDRDGVTIETSSGTGGSNNEILGNFIGVDVNGTAALKNSASGVALIGASVTGNFIGNSDGSGRNIISGNGTQGVYLNADGNQLLGNYIGTDVNGSAKLANGDNGVKIENGANNLIGGTAGTARNIISGNVNYGVIIRGAAATGNVVRNNLIGTDKAGAVALGNRLGVVIGDASDNTIGAPDSNEYSNIIVGSSDSAVLIAGNFAGGVARHNTVINNSIGLGQSGRVIPNAFIGVGVVASADNVIGGLQATEGNLIRNNGGDGIFVSGSISTNNQMLGNVILANAGNGVHLGAPNNLVGSTNAAAANLINRNTGDGVLIEGAAASGNQVLGNFIGLFADGSTPQGNGASGVRILSAENNLIGGATTGMGNLIGDNRRDGVTVEGTNATSNQVLGNLIGTKADGTTALGNNFSGVAIIGPTNSSNVIGGDSAEARNIISANGTQGVFINANGNQVLGNYIGTDVTGALSMGNGANGVYILEGANNTVGGTDSAARNIISGGNVSGVEIKGAGASGNRVQGNFIGTDVTGLTALGNRVQGVGIFNAPGNIVGGAGGRNIISGNAARGIRFDGVTTPGNQVLGNFIGTNVNGTAAIANGTPSGEGDGIQLFDAGNVVIGGATAGEGNLISGNLHSGIYSLDGSDIQVLGNYIGTDVTGATDLGNGLDGITLFGGVHQTIGATSAANTIAFNKRNGILVLESVILPARNNRFASNAIFANTQLGIDLSLSGDFFVGGDGVTPNDAGDGDSGPNNLQNFPVLSSAAGSNTGGPSTTIQGSLNSTASTTFKLQFFANSACDASGYGEGQTYLGELDVTTNPAGDVSFSAMFAVTLNGGQFVTATATDPLGNTSEFSACVPVVNTPAGAPVVVMIDPATITFAGVLTAGNTTVTPIDPATAGALPGSYSICPSCPAFEISTTAVYTPPINICIYLPAIADPAVFANLKLLHNEGGVLVDHTTGANFSSKLICGSFTSLSPFAVAQGTTPTAAPASVTGAVTGVDGAPLGGVLMELSGGAGSRRAITDGLGRFSFADVPTGEFYSLVPLRSNYRFSPASRSFSLFANKPDSSFTGAAELIELDNPLDSPEFFVRQQYLDFLGREPDQGGFEYWSGQINSCNGEAACVGARRLGVSAAFFMSQEFQESGAYVYRLYKAAFGEQEDYRPGYAQFVPDRARVVGGANLSQGKRDFADLFVSRSQFIARYPETMTAAQFVDGILRTMQQGTGLTFSPGERDSFLNDVSTGGHGLMLQHLADLPAFAQAPAVYNRSFVLMEYFGYLRRDPDAEGYEFWLNVLNNQEPNNYRGMVCAFTTSAEYQQRFSSVVSHSNFECGR